MYKIVPGINELGVMVELPYHTFTLNEDNLKKAIQNTKDRKDLFATEAAYQKQLNKFQRALDFLMAHTKEI